MLVLRRMPGRLLLSLLQLLLFLGMFLRQLLRLLLMFLLQLWVVWGVRWLLREALVFLFLFMLQALPRFLLLDSQRVLLSLEFLVHHLVTGLWRGGPLNRRQFVRMNRTAGPAVGWRGVVPSAQRADRTRGNRFVRRCGGPCRNHSRAAKLRWLRSGGDRRFAMVH